MQSQSSKPQGAQTVPKEANFQGHPRALCSEHVWEKGQGLLLEGKPDWCGTSRYPGSVKAHRVLRPTGHHSRAMNHCSLDLAHNEGISGLLACGVQEAASRLEEQYPPPERKPGATNTQSPAGHLPRCPATVLHCLTVHYLCLHNTWHIPNRALHLTPSAQDS
jgi:hypothetical protein